MTIARFGLNSAMISADGVPIGVSIAFASVRTVLANRCTMFVHWKRIVAIAMDTFVRFDRNKESEDG